MEKKHNHNNPKHGSFQAKNHCKTIQEKIGLFVGGDLKVAEHQVVATHLKTCDDCAREAEIYRNCKNDLALLASDKQQNPVSPFFWQGIQKAILVEEDKKKNTPVYKRSVFMVAAAAVLFALSAYLISFFWASNSSEPGPKQPRIVNPNQIEEELPLPSEVPLFNNSEMAPAGKSEVKTLEF